jgi:hypothetical protein
VTPPSSGFARPGARRSRGCRRDLGGRCRGRQGGSVSGVDVPRAQRRHQSSHVGTLLTTAGADFDRVMAVDVRGAWSAMKAWLPGMVSRGAGSVVNLASTAGLEGLVDRFAYSVSKACGRRWASPVLRPWTGARSGVRINCLCPGRVETPFVRARISEYPDPTAAAREMASTQAMGRMGQPQEIAHAALLFWPPMPPRSSPGGPAGGRRLDRGHVPEGLNLLSAGFPSDRFLRRSRCRLLWLGHPVTRCGSRGP